jgi:hypothetical protein
LVGSIYGRSSITIANFIPPNIVNFQVIKNHWMEMLILIKLEAQWAEPVSLTFHSTLRKFNTEPSIDASYLVSVHLPMWFQRRRLTWPPKAILVSDWSISKKSSPLKLLG